MNEKPLLCRGNALKPCAGAIFPDNQQFKKTVGEEMLFILQVSIIKIKGAGIREGIKELLMTERTESY